MPKRKPKTQHPRVRKAIAHVDKLHKAHKKMALDLENTKKALRAMPFIPHTL
jgi:hypothetical protein